VLHVQVVNYMQNVDMMDVWLMALVRGPEASGCLRDIFRDLPKIIFFRYSMRAPCPRYQVRPIVAIRHYGMHLLCRCPMSSLKRIQKPAQNVFYSTL
jgi:hypothetical protein